MQGRIATQCSSNTTWQSWVVSLLADNTPIWRVILQHIRMPPSPPSCLVKNICLCSAAEEEAAKAAAAEAKKVREAEKKLIKKQRQLLRAIAEGQGQQRLLSEGGWCLSNACSAVTAS
jgi:hypothetical protein